MICTAVIDTLSENHIFLGIVTNKIIIHSYKAMKCRCFLSMVHYNMYVDFNRVLDYLTSSVIYTLEWLEDIFNAIGSLQESLFTVKQNVLSRKRLSVLTLPGS